MVGLRYTDRQIEESGIHGQCEESATHGQWEGCGAHRHYEELEAQRQTNSVPCLGYMDRQYEGP